jgi:hypothetical protein
MTSSIVEEKGVAYFFGNGYQEMALVSIYSLRETGWDGRIAVFPIWSYEDQRIIEACKAIGKSRLRVTIGPPVRAMVERDATTPRGIAGMVTKTLIPFVTPYRHTLLIDADTVVVKPIDNIFDGKAPLNLTAFAANWQQLSEHAMRIGRWRAVDAERVTAIEKRGDPAVNTGVMVFSRPATQLVAWNELSMLGSKLDLPDEIAMQLLLPELQYAWLPEIWNYSPCHGPRNGTHPESAHIWHFHGANREQWPQWKTVYEPLRKACETDMPDVYAAVRATLYDSHVRRAPLLT